MRPHIVLSFFILYISLICLPGTAFSSHASDETWEALIDGIKAYSADSKLQEEFNLLCSRNKTALVNGRQDTGSGLYVILDVPVYAEPGNSKITYLKNKDKVVLADESATLEDKEWARIKFLFISERSNAAVSIDDGWIEKSHLTIIE